MRALALILLLSGCGPMASLSVNELPWERLFDTRTEAQKTVAWCDDHVCNPPGN